MGSRKNERRWAAERKYRKHFQNLVLNKWAEKKHVAREIMGSIGFFFLMSVLSRHVG